LDRWKVFRNGCPSHVIYPIVLDTDRTASYPLDTKSGGRQHAGRSDVLWPYERLDAMESKFFHGESDEQPHAFGHVPVATLPHVDCRAAFSGQPRLARDPA